MDPGEPPVPPPPPPRSRRIGGWGYDDETMEPPAALLGWLGRTVGPPGSALGTTRIAPPLIAPRSLGDVPAPSSTEPWDRLAHARGQGLIDVVRVRGGLISALPEAVVRPTSSNEVEAVLGHCQRQAVRVIPWGGGTSVTGGVNVVGDGDGPLTISMD